MSAFDVYATLTRAEKNYLWWHPGWHMYYIKTDAEEAAERADRFFVGSHNGSGDAFRHCYWSALLARDIGPENARAFTTAHEENPDNPSDEKAMDLHNNAVGIEIGAKLTNGSDDEIALSCSQALYAGRLVIIEP